VLTWLENWLHNIIAVVLFAIIVELLIPNSKFLKYSRLVIGLILLLTILSPILKIFDKDYETQIDASYTLWEQQLHSAETQTLSLQDIQAKARDLQEKRDSETVKLTASAIETQMKQELHQANVNTVANVTVDLALKNKSNVNEPYINSVTIYITRATEPVAQDGATEENVTDGIVAVDPIDIDIVVENSSELQTLSEQTDIELTGHDRTTIYEVLKRNWNIKQNQIVIVAKDSQMR
jgi:stage III sporulation protein AF